MPDSYIICATPRTGSTLLCDLLAATKVAGNPDSFFMRDIDPVWRAELGLPAPERLGDADYATAYLEAAIRAGKGQTAVFGLRLMKENLADLLGLIDGAFPGGASDKARLESAFGPTLFIHLSRQDKLAQAISMVKAEQTGLWHIASDGSELERLGPSKEPEYDFGRIADKLAVLDRYDADWQAWFDAQGIAPLRIGYESLSANPAEAVARICQALGVPPPAAEHLRPGVAKLGDAVSLEWAQRFEADRGLKPGS